MKAILAADEIKLKVKETVKKNETLTALTMLNIIINNTKSYIRATQREKKIIRNLFFRETLPKIQDSLICKINLWCT